MVEEEEVDEGKGEVKENGEVPAGEKVSGESTDAAGSDIVKTVEKGSSFFWNTKREDVSSEKTTKQATEEELNDTQWRKASMKTEEKTASFFWNTKKETEVSEKTAKQEELNEDTKTVDLATEVLNHTLLTSCCTYI